MPHNNDIFVYYNYLHEQNSGYRIWIAPGRILVMRLTIKGEVEYNYHNKKSKSYIGIKIQPVGIFCKLFLEMVTKLIIFLFAFRIFIVNVNRLQFYYTTIPLPAKILWKFICGPCAGPVYDESPWRSRWKQQNCSECSLQLVSLTNANLNLLVSYIHTG